MSIQFQLPTAPPGEICALDGAFFNRLMAIISQVANLSATPPLTLNDGPGGRVLSVLATGSTDNWVVLTGSATKNATYTGHAFTTSLVSGFDATASGTVAQTDVGSAGSSTVYLVNVREIGQSTNDLATGFLPLLFRGTPIGTAVDGKAVYLIDGLQWENC